MNAMRWLIAFLALAGMVAAALALREHYRTEGPSPCSINEKWDCGTVNKSRFASIGGVFDKLTNRNTVLSDDDKPRFKRSAKFRWPMLVLPDTSFLVCWH